MFTHKIPGMFNFRQTDNLQKRQKIHGRKSLDLEWKIYHIKILNEIGFDKIYQITSVPQKWPNSPE